MTTQKMMDVCWPPVFVSGAIALLFSAAVHADRVGISLFLLVPLAFVAVWCVFGLLMSIKARHAASMTAYTIALLFVYFPMQAVLPGHEAIRIEKLRFDFDSKRDFYSAAVKNHKLIDPARTLIIFEGPEKLSPGEVDERVVYDETEQIALVSSPTFLQMVADQSNDDLSKFESCRWKAWKLEGHFFALDFYC